LISKTQQPEGKRRRRAGPFLRLQQSRRKEGNPTISRRPNRNLGKEGASSTKSEKKEKKSTFGRGGGLATPPERRGEGESKASGKNSNTEGLAEGCLRRTVEKELLIERSGRVGLASHKNPKALLNPPRGEVSSFGARASTAGPRGNPTRTEWVAVAGRKKKKEGRCMKGAYRGKKKR